MTKEACPASRIGSVIDKIPTERQELRLLRTPCFYASASFGRATGRATDQRKPMSRLEAIRTNRHTFCGRKGFWVGKPMMTLLGPKLKKKPRQFPDGVKVGGARRKVPRKGMTTSVPRELTCGSTPSHRCQEKPRRFPGGGESNQNRRDAYVRQPSERGKPRVLEL